MGAAVIWVFKAARTSKVAHLHSWQSMLAVSEGISVPLPVALPCGWSFSQQGVWVAGGGSIPRANVPKGRKRKLSVLVRPSGGLKAQSITSASSVGQHSHKAGPHFRAGVVNSCWWRSSVTYWEGEADGGHFWKPLPCIVPFGISKDEATLLGRKGLETSQNNGQRIKVTEVVDLSCFLIMFPPAPPLHCIPPCHVGREPSC